MLSNRHTHRPSTVTLAAHAHRGLINSCYTYSSTIVVVIGIHGSDKYIHSFPLNPQAVGSGAGYIRQLATCLTEANSIGPVVAYRKFLEGSIIEPTCKIRRMPQPKIAL